MTSVVGSVEGVDIIFSIGPVTGRAGITAVDFRVAVIPGVGIVSIVRVVIILGAVSSALDLPDEAGDVVTNHSPLGCRIRQIVTGGIQLGVGARPLELGILAVEGLTRCWAGIKNIALCIVTLRLAGIGQLTGT